MVKLAGEDEWINPNRILWAAFRNGFKNLVLVGEDSEGNVEVFSSLGGKKANSLMTAAIRQVKRG